VSEFPDITTLDTVSKSKKSKKTDAAKAAGNQPESTKSTSQALTLEVVTPASEAEGRLRGLAREAIRAASEAMGKYWELVVYIRENQIPPAAVRKALIAEGFADSRVSEVIKVISAPPKVYEDYKAKVIGFRLALQRSREDSPKKKKKAPTEAELFKAEATDVLESYIPITGLLPEYMGSPLVVNGRKIIIASLDSDVITEREAACRWLDSLDPSRQNHLNDVLFLHEKVTSILRSVKFVQ